jgi:hypothetical protein
MQYPHVNFKSTLFVGGKKCNIHIMILNPHYLWEAKMKNLYVRHGTFLVQIDDLKSIQ